MYGSCAQLEDEVLRACRNEPFTHGLTDVVQRYQPEIRPPDATTQGRDLAGSVAATLKTGLTADCKGLTIDPDNLSLLSSRPTFGGNSCAAPSPSSITARKWPPCARVHSYQMMKS